LQPAFPPPAIYPNVATRLADFGEHGPNIALFYNRITASREGAERLQRYYSGSTPVPPAEFQSAADRMIKFAETGAEHFAALKTCIKSQDDLDIDAVTNITAATKIWSAHAAKT
jgi:hypothetical protein